LSRKNFFGRAPPLFVVSGILIEKPPLHAKSSRNVARPARIGDNAPFEILIFFASARGPELTGFFFFRFSHRTYERFVQIWGKFGGARVSHSLRLALFGLARPVRVPPAKNIGRAGGSGVFLLNCAQQQTTAGPFPPISRTPTIRFAEPCWPSQPFSMAPAAGRADRSHPGREIGIPPITPTNWVFRRQSRRDPPRERPSGPSERQRVCGSTVMALAGRCKSCPENEMSNCRPSTDRFLRAANVFT